MAVVARLLLYLAAMMVLGDACARWVRGEAWHSRPASRDGNGPVFAWLAALIALSLLFVLQFLALELAPTVSDVAMLARQTAWGNGWLMLAGCAMVGVIGGVARAPLTGRFLIAIAFAIAMGGLGHAAADDLAPWTSRALDATHVVATGVWLGTLFSLGRSPALPVWERFSRLAVIAAPLSVLSGTGSALLRLRDASLTQVIASDYGRLLSAKLVIVAVILAVGARHRRQLLARREPTVASVRFELLLALAVLGVTAVLTATAPPGE
ncbi:MAG: CopD family protein [Gemmatimonas sp.]